MVGDRIEGLAGRLTDDFSGSGGAGDEDRVGDFKGVDDCSAIRTGRIGEIFGSDSVGMSERE